MTPEARARIKIDAKLEAAGWIVQSRGELNLHAGPGVAVRAVPTPTGPAVYVLFLDRKVCAVLEAKPAGVTLLGAALQAPVTPSTHRLVTRTCPPAARPFFAMAPTPCRRRAGSLPCTGPSHCAAACKQPRAFAAAWLSCLRWTPRA